MKKNITIFCLLLISSTAFADTGREISDLLQQTAEHHRQFEKIARKLATKCLDKGYELGARAAKAEKIVNLQQKVNALQEIQDEYEKTHAVCSTF